jgi:putative peptidoglycan lipid II flippase
MHADSIQSIFHSAKRFFTGTLLSRVMGAVRDICMAASFGSSAEIATFMVAYRLANLFRRLLGEGNLSSSFIPVFESLRAEKRLPFLFYRDTIFSYMIPLIGFIVILQLGCFMAAPYAASYQKILELSFWMLPGLLFIILSSLNTALLQCQKKYFSSSFAPVGFNLIWIGALFFLKNQEMDLAIRTLSMVITLAFAGQWLITAVHVRREIRLEMPWKEWFKPRLFSSDFQRLLKPMSLSILGIGAMQINSTLDVIFAKIADPSGPAYLWYAIRIQQLPLSLFGVALAGALLPPLTRAIRENDLERYHHLLNSGLKRTLLLMVPLTFACFAISASGIDLLYGRGLFQRVAIEQTTFCLWGYLIGLIPSTITLLLASGCYAKTSYITPLKASLLSVISNLLLNTLFIFGFGWKAPSVAIATGLSACLNALFLLRSYRSNIDFWGFFGKLSLAGLIAWLSSLVISHLGDFDGTISMLQATPFPFCSKIGGQIWRFVYTNGTYWMIFLGIARLMNLEEVFSLFKRAKVPTSN